MSILRAAVSPTLTLEVAGKKYTIAFPLAAVIRAEDRTGLELKNPADWFSIPYTAVPNILLSGLERHHPDITDKDVADICDDLNPEICTEIAQALAALAFPKWTARFQEQLEKMKAGYGSKA